MRRAVSVPALVIGAALGVAGASPAAAFSDADVLRGFASTVFDAEYRGFSLSGTSKRLKKFAGPVRVFIDNRAGLDRRQEVAQFVRSLPRLIAGLDIALVARASGANYQIHVVDRVDYAEVAGRSVLRRSDGYAPGRCITRIITGTRGTARADAVIVSDEGEAVFRRCLIEEVLQGLGPANDDRTLADSVFNDTSRHTTFTGFDRLILNMLYDPRLKPGMTLKQATPLLPVVLQDAKRRVR